MVIIWTLVSFPHRLALKTIKCWKCENCPDPLSVSKGESIDCTNSEQLVACLIQSKQTLDAPRTTVSRGCAALSHLPSKFPRGKCTVVHGVLNKFKDVVCLCNNGDNCNKDQIDGIPPRVTTTEATKGGSAGLLGKLEGVIMMIVSLMAAGGYWSLFSIQLKKYSQNVLSALVLVLIWISCK